VLYQTPDDPVTDELESRRGHDGIQQGHCERAGDEKKVVGRGQWAYSRGTTKGRA
jgi:hypothetical protein